MKHRLLIAAFLLCAPTASRAQVSVNDNALDALGKPAAPHHPAPRQPALHHPAAPTATLPSAPKPPARPAIPATHPAPPPAPPLPAIPAAPPRAAAIPPPGAAVPTRPVPPPPTIPVAAGAPGAAVKIADGMRVTFGPDHADLNPATVEALRTLAHVASASPTTSINVAAYAAGTPEDPSTPRRLSLSRALAVRSVMINEGIPSTRIYVRALGTNDPAGGPADRVDVTLGTPADQPAAPAPSPAPGAPGAPRQPAPPP